ncbi:MAG: hypothetical protein VXY77_03955 [Pseudomonadota bacterium]|nr:hypothetical protein [Pseudomonadota bacterium]
MASFNICSLLLLLSPLVHYSLFIKACLISTGVLGITTQLFTDQKIFSTKFLSRFCHGVFYLVSHFRYSIKHQQLSAKNMFKQISTVLRAIGQAIKKHITYPTTEKIILAGVSFNVSITLCKLLYPGYIFYFNALHDALLMLGSFQLSSWVKQSMQSALAPHNNRSINIKTISDNNTHHIIPLSQVTKGMRLVVETPIILPMKCAAIKQVTIVDDKGEKRKRLSAKHTIPANTHCITGTVVAKEDCPRINHTDQYAQTEDNDKFINFYMASTFIVALISGMINGFLSNWIVGFRFFTANLMVSCPCVFILTKPIIINRLLRWLNVHTKIEFQKMFSMVRPSEVIFDRTHTMYEEDPDDPQGPYKLIPKGKWVVKALVAMGMRVRFLSGRGKDRAESAADRQKCIDDFKDILRPEDIMFNGLFHDNLDAKQGIVKNIQEGWGFNRLRPVLKPMQKFIKFCQAPFFREYVVMVGDGNNDVSAMKQSDIAICVSKSLNNINHKALKECNVFVSHSNIHDIVTFLQGVIDTHRFHKILTRVALVYNIAMGLLLNGLYYTLTGLSFPISSICIGMSTVCPLITALALVFRIKEPIKKMPQLLQKEEANTQKKPKKTRKVSQTNMPSFEGRAKPCCSGELATRCAERGPPEPFITQCDSMECQSCHGLLKLQ